MEAIRSCPFSKLNHKNERTTSIEVITSITPTTRPPVRLVPALEQTHELSIFILQLHVGPKKFPCHLLKMRPHVYCFFLTYSTLIRE